MMPDRDAERKTALREGTLVSGTLYTNIKAAFLANAEEQQLVCASQFAGNSVLVFEGIKRAYIWMEKNGAVTHRLVAALSLVAAGELEFRIDDEHLWVCRPNEFDLIHALMNQTRSGSDTIYFFTLGLVLGYLEPGMKMSTAGAANLLWIIDDGCETPSPRLLFNEVVHDPHCAAASSRLVMMKRSLAPHSVTLEIATDKTGLRKAFKKYADY